MVYKLRCTATKTMSEKAVYQDLQFAERAKCVLCMAVVPCTMFCGVPMLMYLHTKGPSGPSDASRLSDDEAKLYLDSLQGEQTINLKLLKQ